MSLRWSLRWAVFLAIASAVSASGFFVAAAEPVTRGAGTQGYTPVSREQARLTALKIVRNNELRAGRMFRPARITAIRLIEPGVTVDIDKRGRMVVPTKTGNGLSDAGAPWWAVQVEGTFLSCGGWWCNPYTKGVLSLASRGDSKSAGGDAVFAFASALPDLVPLYQAQSALGHGWPRSTAAATKIALRYLRDNEAALGAAMTSPSVARIVKLTRLHAGNVYPVNRVQGGFKAGPPTWVAKVEGTIANCIDDHQGSKGDDPAVPASYRTRRCTLTSSGYLAIPDNRDFPSAVILTGKRNTVPLTAILPPCRLTNAGRLLC
ncbi:hypothetical protein [Gaiella sp.]|uniref:hypothetical protein n=1 Tax=Gaiella sp. TaxID=2663207 RepID=UPI0039830C78